MSSYIPVYNNVKNIFIVSSTTLLSRISGFVRDACFFGMFGLSEIGAAFLFAFTIPNLFRRLLGEGALASAVMPILADQYVKHGKEAVAKLLNSIIIRLSGVLLLIIFIGIGLSFFVTKYKFLEYKWVIGAHFIMLVLPYMLFVCIAAVISAALNILGHFFAASLNAVWLNVSMITALIIGKIFRLNEIQGLDLLSIGVVVGGVIQFIVPMLAFRKIASTTGSSADFSKELKEIMRLFWPGFFGAAVTQINLVTSRSLSYFYSASSVSILYLSNRLTELPLGIFAIAISTVFFPDMSKSALKSGGFLKKSFNQGIFALLWILLPSALGLFCVKKEVLAVFFEWGNFGISETGHILPVLSIYCISIPFYGISSFLTRSFHSIKDMRTPVYIGCILLIINIVTTIVLMKMFGIIGIASANTISIILQTYMLYFKLHQNHKDFSIEWKFDKILIIFLGLFGIFFVVYLGKLILKSDLSVLFCVVPTAATLYLLVTYPILKFYKK